MRLLIDSDVLLDFIGERESTAAAWVKLHAMELAGAAGFREHTLLTCRGPVPDLL